MSGQQLSLPFRRAGAPGAVAATVGVNDDPAALGCPEWARGFPWCRATVDHPARGYADALGWIQLVEWDGVVGGAGFHSDPFAPLGEVSHPFCWFGYAPTLFDAPHTEGRPESSEFVAHSFLCGLGPRPLEMPRETDAVLGFEWRFRIEGGEITPAELSALGPEAWEGHREYLGSSYRGWTFLPGFSAW